MELVIINFKGIRMNRDQAAVKMIEEGVYIHFGGYAFGEGAVYRWLLGCFQYYSLDGRWCRSNGLPASIICTIVADPALPKAKTKVCLNCQGRGWVTGFPQNQQCSVCNGTGIAWKKKVEPKEEVKPTVSVTTEKSKTGVITYTATVSNAISEIEEGTAILNCPELPKVGESNCIKVIIEQVLPHIYYVEAIYNRTPVKVENKVVDVKCTLRDKVWSYTDNYCYYHPIHTVNSSPRFNKFAWRLPNGKEITSRIYTARWWWHENWTTIYKEGAKLLTPHIHMFEKQPVFYGKI